MKLVREVELDERDKKEDVEKLLYDGGFLYSGDCKGIITVSVFASKCRKLNGPNVYFCETNSRKDFPYLVNASF